MESNSSKPDVRAPKKKKEQPAPRFPEKHARAVEDLRRMMESGAWETMEPGYRNKRSTREFLKQFKPKA